MRQLRALGAAAVLLALLIGWPLLLTGWTRYLLPDQVPGRAQWEVWVQQPITPTTVQVIVVMLLWLGWIWLVVTVIREIVRRTVSATGRVATAVGRVRLPRPTPGGVVQTMAGGLVGTVVIGLSTGPAHANPPTTAAPPPPTGPTATAVQDSTPLTPTDHVPGEWGEVATPALAGVELRSGGWASTELVTLVAGLVGAWWLHRRRHYRPGPPDPNRADRDLAPLPAPVVALLTAATETDEDKATTPLGAPPSPEGNGLSVPAGGVGLSGPGAVAAARGLLATTTASTPNAMVWTTVGLWGRLLPDQPAAPPVTTYPDADVLLGAVQELALTRTDPTTPHPGPPWPPLLVLAPELPAQDQPAWAVAVRLSGTVGIHAAILDRWEFGPTWTITAAGHLTTVEEPAPDRISVLDPATTAAVLTLASPNAAQLGRLGVGQGSVRMSMPMVAW